MQIQIGPESIFHPAKQIILILALKSFHNILKQGQKYKKKTSHAKTSEYILQQTN